MLVMKIGTVQSETAGFGDQLKDAMNQGMQQMTDSLASGMQNAADSMATH
jgi:hypothetical protein